MAGKEETIRPADLSGVKQGSLKGRKNLVSIGDFAGLYPPESPAGGILSSFPDILAGKNLKTLVARIRRARKAGAMVGAGLGGHVIKCGLSPVIIDLMERGWIGALSLNGAGAIHDFEIAAIGATSEDVGEGLGKGTFGMARETFDALNKACGGGAKDESGFGAALGRRIQEGGLPHKDTSLLASAYRLGIPATVHVAVGTDIVHMHPGLDAESLGRATHTDFRILVSVASRLGKGVWMNIGSAVILPEVFMKALNVARNMGEPVKDLFTANLDMLQHYRPRVNVVSRPSGEGVALTCHHEILLPLLRLALLEGNTDRKGES